MYDSGARWQYSLIPRFSTIAPLAEKYYHLSPYAYCAGDPVNLVDPDGRKIYFADGVPEWFKERFAATIRYMNERGTSWIFKKIQDSDNIYYIDYVEEMTKDKHTMYDPNKKTIYWNPNLFVKTSNEVVLYPATILAHEGAHILQDIKYNNSWNEQATTKDAEYDNKLDREVITTIEQDVAIKHGHIYKGEVTRKDHSGEYKILSENDYKKIFENVVPTEIPEINRELIDIYLYNTRWIKTY